MTLLTLYVGSTPAQPPPDLPKVSEEGTGNERPEPNVRRIYVPVAELDALLKEDRQGVLLPREEFHRLYEAAKQAEESAPKQPAPVVVAAAEYAGQLERETLSLSAEVRFTQFDDVWQMISLPIGGLSVTSAVLDGQPAPVSRSGKNRNTLVVFSSSRGDHRLRLELSLPLKSVGSDWLAEFQTLQAPSGNLTLAVAEGKSLLVDGLKYDRSNADEPASDFRVPLGGRTRVSLQITDRDLREAADALVFAHTAYGVNVSVGEVTWTTQTSVQTFGQSLSQLTFVVPSDLEVAAVESVGLEEWTLSEVNRGREIQITLDYRQPFDGRRDVTIRGVLVPDDEDWTLPNLELNDADSHVGTIVVRHGPEVRLQAEHDEDVRPVTGEADVGSLTYRTMTPSFDLDFRTLGKARSVHVAMTNLLDVSDDGLDLQTVMDVETYFVPLFEARVTLPADFEITAAAVEGAPINWSLGTGVAGVIEVRVPLEPPLNPGQTRRVSLSAHADPEDWPLQRDPALLPLPEVALPQADMVEARYGIMADDDFDVRTVELTGLDPARKADLTGLRQAAVAAGRELRLGFNYQDTVFSGQLEVVRKQTRLAVSTWSLSRLGPERVETELQLFVTVEGGGTEGLMVDLPETAGTDLRFLVEPGAGQEAEGRVEIVEQSAADPVDGRRVWALRFDRRMRGDHVVSVSFVETRPDEESVTLSVASLTGADRQNGWIAVEARKDQRLTVQATDADGAPLPTVDPIDLPGMDDDVGDRRIIAGVRYSQPGYEVVVSEQTLEAIPVPTALADRADVVSVLSGDRLMLHRLDVAFRAVGMQSLLVGLPEGADVWATSIDGAPVEVRQTEGGYRVPLEAGDDPSAPRTLRLIYRSQLKESGVFGRWRQSPPELACVTGAGEKQPLEVLRQQWTLHYPRDVVLLDSRGIFRPTAELTNDGWLNGARALITIPTLDEVSRRVGIVAAIVLALWVVALVWRRFGKRSLIVALVGVPIVSLGVLFYSFAKQEVASSKYYLGSDEAAPAAGRVDAEEDADAGGETGGAGFGGGAFGRGAGGGFGGGGGGEAVPALGAIDASESMMRQPPSDADAAAPAELSLQTRQSQQVEAEPAARPTDRPQMAGEQSPATQRATPAAPNEDFLMNFAERDRYVDGVIAGMPAMPARGALLSLSLDLEPPAAHRSTTFETLADPRRGDEPAIDVSYAGRSQREAIALVVAVGLAMLIWILRRMPLKPKLALLLLTIVVPIALAPVVPGVATMIVEGVLLGGLVGACLWGIQALVPFMAGCCQCCRPASWSSPTGTEKTMTALLFAASFSIAANVGLAQESKPQPAPPVVAADGAPTVVVPYDGDDPLRADRVYLPQKLFRELWQRAYPDRQHKPEAPVEGLVAEALYSVDVADAGIETKPGESKVRAQGRFVVFGFRDRPVWVPLPLDQVSVVSATLNDEPAVLRPREDGQPELLVREAGVHVLDVAFEVTADLRPQSGQFVLPLRPVASGALTVTIPASDQQQTIRVVAAEKPAVTRDVANTDEGRQRTAAAVDAGGPVRVSWQPKTRRGDRDNLVQVESRVAVAVADAGVEMTADFALQVRQGTLADVPFSFPESVRLKRITGPDVGGWQIDGTGEQRTLTIFLRRNVDDQTRVTAELFVPQEDRDEEFTLDVPAFAPLDVARETGEVAVLAGAHLDVRAAQASGLRQLDRDAVRLPESLSRTAEKEPAQTQLAYRFTSRPWQLGLSVRPRPPQTLADCEHGIYLGFRKILYRSRMTFNLTGAPRQTLRISLSDEFLVTDVLGDAVEDWFLEDIDLIVDLGQPRVGRTELILEGHVARDEGDDAAVVITPLPLELDRQQSVLAVWVDPVFSATLDSFDTWRTIDRAQLPQAVKALHSEQPQFAFRSPELEPEIVGFDLIRRQPQIAADGVTLIAVSDVSVDYGMTLRWTIERAATDTLVFTTPDWLQDRLLITGDDVRQTTQEATDDGRLRWTVQLADAVRGQYLLTAAATLPPPADGSIAAPDVRFELPPLTPGGDAVEVESQQSFGVLVNLSRGRITPVGDLEPLITRREQLPLVLGSDLIAQAMAVVRLPAGQDVAWTLQGVTEQQTQAAQVTSAELTSVLAADGGVRTEATYRVRNRGQQFLALKLPEDSRILSVLVKNEPARCLSASVGEQPVSLVPLPQTSLADLSFLVRVVVQGKIPDVDRLTDSPLGAEYPIPAPSVVSPNESREYGVPVVHTNWTVHVPDDVDASPVVDAARTNVSYQAPSAGLKMIERELYRELADQSKLALNKFASTAQRRKAASNITRLNEELSNYWSVQGGSSASFDFNDLSDADRDFDDRKQELLSESKRVADEVRQELSTDSWERMDGKLNFNTLGQHFIAGNNMQIAEQNPGSGVVVSGEGGAWIPVRPIGAAGGFQTRPGGQTHRQSGRVTLGTSRETRVASADAGGPGHVGRRRSAALTRAGRRDEFGRSAPVGAGPAITHRSWTPEGGRRRNRA